MMDDFLKGVKNLSDWNQHLERYGVSFNSSHDDLVNMANVDVDNFIQKLTSNNTGFSSADIDSIRQSVMSQKQNAADLLTGIKDAIELKGADLGKNISMIPSSMHDNLRFASVIGPNESMMASMGLTPDQVNHIVMNTANQVYSDLGLQDIPTRVNINYGTGVKVDANGVLDMGSRTGVGEINLNYDNIISNLAYNGTMSQEDIANKISNTVSHEMRHQWQQHYDNANYRADVENYIDSTTDFGAYRDQSIEIDARQYGNNASEKYAKKYLDEAREQFPTESYTPHYQEDIVEQKGFVGKLKDKISGFFGRGSQSSALEGGGPTLENSAQIGKQLKLEDLQDFSGKLSGMYSNDEITIHQLTYGRQQVNNAIQSGRSSNYESFNISNPSFFSDPNNVKNFTGTVKEIDSVPNLVFSDMEQLSSTDYKKYNTAMLYDERLRNSITYAEPIRSANRAQRAIANDSEGLFTLRNYLSHEIATQSDYAPLFGMSDTIGEGALNGKSMHDITYNFLRNGPNAVKVNGQSIDAQPFFYFDENKNLKVVAEPKNPSDSFEKFIAQPEIAKGRRDFMEEMVVNKTYFNDPKNIETAVNALEQQGFHISTSVDSIAHGYRLEEKINDMKKDYAKHPERYNTKSHPQTQASGGGGGKKPPEKKPTATPEPPERGKKQNTQRQNRRSATKNTNKIKQAPETKPQPEIKPDAKINADKQTKAGAKIKKGTNTLRSNDHRTVKDTSKLYGMNVTESSNPKMKYDVSGGHAGMNLELKGAIDKNGNLAFLNVHDKNINDVYNLLGNGSKKTGAASSKQWKDYVDYANSYDVNLPRWATHNYRQRRRTKETYNSEQVTKEIENIGHEKEIPDYIDKVFGNKDSNTTSETGPKKSTQESVDLANNGPQGQNFDKYSPEGQQKIANDKIDDLEKRYSNNELTDEEYIEELNKIHNDHIKPNPIDDSNVLNTPSGAQTEQVTPQSIYEDFLNNKKVPLDGKLEADLMADKFDNLIDNYNLNINDVDTSAEQQTLNKMLSEEKRLRENRIFEQEEYDNLKQQVIDNFNEGGIDVDQMNAQIDELDKRFKPLTKEEVQDYIDAASDPLVRDPNDPFHIDPSNRKSVIEKKFSGDGYEGTVQNGFVQDIKIGDEEYTVKTRSTKTEGGVIDIFDSNGEVVIDPDIVKDVNSKIFDETNKYYENLTDAEWDEVIQNAADHRFDRHTVNDAISKKDAKMLDANDAIEKRQKILQEQRTAVQEQYDNTKGKKKKKALAQQRNELDIKKLQAEKLKQRNIHQVNANNQRKAAREKFNKTLGLDAYEAGSDEFKKAYEALKGTDEFINAEKILKKDLSDINKVKKAAIKNSNKILDSQINGLMGKGLTLNNMITIGTAAIGAVNKYKESRAEGKGVVSSAARAGATAVAAEVMGPWTAPIVAGARMLGNAAVEAGDMLYKESRRMNSASNFTPLGGVNFQDSQELATMRQSGMELAKMSQYNLEQTLMGAEAKHLHR